MFYFLREDLDRLDGQIEELTDKLREAGQEMGASCEQGAETYHDNAPYEEAVRAFGLHLARLKELSAIRKQARLILSPTSTAFVAVGTQVTVLDLDTSETKSFKVGSFLTFTEDTISYHSPFARILIGAEKGEIREGEISGKKKRFRILSIEKP